MTRRSHSKILAQLGLVVALAGVALQAAAAEKALLDILLGNGLITQAQYDQLMKKDTLTTRDILPAAATPAKATGAAQQLAAAPADSSAVTRAADPAYVDRIAKQVQDTLPVTADYTDKGFRLETRNGRFQTNLQWRLQSRYSHNYDSDPRQVSQFSEDTTNTFEERRARMKIGGFGYEPWLQYYFEVDLQTTRDTDDQSFSSSSRLLDWRIDVAKYEAATLRVGQWKVDLNRERVDSSGRQQFAERSIVNRQFTVDRQMGIQLRGHLFQETLADMRYWLGTFTGEGRGNSNDDNKLMYMGRLQWNFMGRDLPFRQGDIEYTEQPTGSFAVGAMTNQGRCTRWSSSGCGSLDGFTPPALAQNGQYEIDQVTQELAFKWRGFSTQQEYSWKNIRDTIADEDYELTGGYAQMGYFFHYLFPVLPAPLEFALRYATVTEPNSFNLSLDNKRDEYSAVANWYFSGHNNKLSLDYSYLTLDDDFLMEDVSGSRVRVQWDISF